VTVDPTKTAQTMLGFGAAFTDAACFTLSRLSDSDRASLLHTMFGKDQHALSVGRIAIGAERLPAPRPTATTTARPIRS